MPKFNNLSKIVIAAVLVVVAIILVIIYGTTGNGHSGTALNTPGDASVTAQSPTQTPAQTSTTSGQPHGSAPTTSRHPSVPITPTPNGPVISFITPVNNDIWKINTQNVISWNAPGNISGSISLIDAKTNQSVGVILPQVGPNQTSYAWNTRDILLDRTNPLKKDVIPGTYMIRIAYDGNNIKPAMSPTFTITN